MGATGFLLDWICRDEILMHFKTNTWNNCIFEKIFKTKKWVSIPPTLTSQTALFLWRFQSVELYLISFCHPFILLTESISFHRKCSSYDFFLIPKKSDCHPRFFWISLSDFDSNSSGWNFLFSLLSLTFWSCLTW